MAFASFHTCYLMVAAAVASATLPRAACDSREQELDSFFVDCSNFEGDDMFGGPVCGADSVTYHNIIHLTCLNHKRSKAGLPLVNMTSRGPCPEAPGGERCPWSPVYVPVCGSDNNTYANVEALHCRAKLNAMPDLKVISSGECCRQDPCIGGWPWGRGPVCASNARTYQSPADVHCLKKFHSSVEIIHEGGCSVKEISNTLRSRSHICAIARNRYEWNPVCGADHYTYANPFVFLCYKPHMRSTWKGECRSSLREECRLAQELDHKLMSSRPPLMVKKGDGEDDHRPEEEDGRDHEEHELQRALATYRLENNDKVVCANDGLTYHSIHHLRCSSTSNKYLELVHDGRCLPEDSPCVRRPPLQDKGHPVCGSDGVTYASHDLLACVQRSKDPTLKYLHDGLCVPDDLEGKLWG